MSKNSSALPPRSLSHPVLAPRSLDYCPGNKYEGQSIIDGNSIEIKHRVEGDNLVSELLKGNAAVFGCIVASPYAAYRVFHVGNSNGETHFQQKIEWNPENVFLPIFFLPVVVATKSFSCPSLSEKDGVRNFLLGGKIQIKKGSLLAWEEFMQSAPPLKSLLKLKEIPGLDPGILKADIVVEGGLHGRIQVAKVFLDQIKRRQFPREHRISILTQALTGIFSQLASEYREKDKWQEHLTLIALHKQMKEKGIGTWDEDDFDPAYAATKFYPHKFPERSSEDDDA